ncbi:MAG: hypothetical protein KGQ59_09365, partial [Bdellovibrionales bacterium]|nr:hypothetical protein [Bdellovibrionales bacterium]
MKALAKFRKQLPLMVMLTVFAPGCAQLGNHIGLITADISSEEEKQDAAPKTDEAPPEAKTETEEKLDPEFPTPLKAPPRGAITIFPGASRGAPNATPAQPQDPLNPTQDLQEELQAKVLCIPRSPEDFTPEPQKTAQTTAPTVEALRERIAQEAQKPDAAPTTPEAQMIAQTQSEPPEKPKTPEDRTPAAENKSANDPTQNFDPQEFLIITVS